MIQASPNYLLANAAMAKTPVYLITIEGYARVFTNQGTGIAGQFDWIEYIEDISLTVNDLDGAADQSQPLIFTVQDHGHAITADFPTFVFEGKKVVLQAGFVGMAQADFVTLFTGVIDSVESGASSSVGTSSNNSYIFTCDNNDQRLTQVIFQTGDDGNATDSNHPRTILGHPLDILIDILENQIVPGYAPTEIDLAKIQLYRDTVYSGIQFQFPITSPPAAKDFIEAELMKPLGAYRWTNNLGQITVNFFQPLDATPLMELNPDLLTIGSTGASSVPMPEQADLINEVSFRFDDDGTGNFLSEAVQDYAPSITKYGLFGQTIIESKGVRSGLQGFFLAELTSQLIFERYGLKALKFGETNDMPVIWKASLLEPGDFVTLTHPLVPDRDAGTFGLVGLLCEVMDRTWHFSDATVSYKLLARTSGCAFKEYFITPDCEPDFTAASAEDQNKYMFLCGDDDKYSDGTAGHTLA